ncbi:MAG: NAD-binding protein [Gammaproteobacteria bacterium]
MNLSDPSLRTWRRLRQLFPQVPLGLFLILGGAVNILVGSHANVFSDLTQTVSQASVGVSLTALGGGAQIILGAGLVLSGVGLFWRIRVAWSFACLLLLITVGVNVLRAHFGFALIVPGMAFLLLAFFHRDFDRQTLFGSVLVSFVGIAAVLAYGTFGSYLLGDQFAPKIHDLISALYYTVVTLSTVGYGDIHPTTVAAQGYVITMIVFGLSVFASTIFSVLGPALSHRFEQLLKPSRGHTMKRDHVIIVGAGVIARNTASELVRRHIPFVQVVPTDKLPPLDDQPVVTGDVGDDQVLKQAGIAQANMLIAAQDDDNENAYTSLAAKDLNPELRVLAVASSRRAIRRLKLARADLVFAPAEVGSRLLANLIEGETLPEAFRDLLNSDSTP